MTYKYHPTKSVNCPHKLKYKTILAALSLQLLIICDYDNEAGSITDVDHTRSCIGHFGTSKRVLASDPDILSDYVLPQNSTSVDASFFTYTGFRGIFDQAPKTVKTTKASMVEFPALNGQSVSYAVLQFPPQTLLPPHTRPDAAGLLFLLDGSLEVGLIDTKNNLYTQKLQAGDMFVFPKGLIHYQYNTDPQLPATAIAAFGSASARAVAVPSSVFASGIDDVIIAKSLKTDIDTIRKIKAGLTTS